MAWPLASHFSAVLQNPRVAFRDPVIQQCVVEKDQRKQPRPWAGAFAVVYKGIAPDGRAFAIRVFTTESPERRERYEQISAYLRLRRLPCLVDFEYRDEAIRSAGDGKWYPLILMDWVEGKTLFEWARDKALANDRRAFATAAENWAGLVHELADANIAHGDLQHANIMVDVQDAMRLVDYDCVCVPSLVGRRNLEVGVEPYQHPSRNATTHLSLDLDNFSALVIHVALRGLAADPGLWRKHVETPGHDKLLFRTEDFHSRGLSPLCQDLRRSPEKEVRDLTEQLLSAVYLPMEEVPRLTNLTNSYATIGRLLASERWEEAVEILNRRGQFRDAPEHLKPLIHQAYEHVCRLDAWSTFMRIGDEPSEMCDRRLVAGWNEALFADHPPAQQMRERINGARHHVAALDRLRLLVQQASAGTSFKLESAIVDAAGHLPKGYEYGLKGRAVQASRVVRAVRSLQKAVRKGDDPRIAESWKAVVRLHAESLVPSDTRGRLDSSRRRLVFIQSLAELPHDLPLDALDERLSRIWQEDLAEGLPEAEPWRIAHEWAVYRRHLLGRLDESIEARDDEAVLLIGSDECLAEYPLTEAQRTAITRARDSATRAEAMLEAITANDRHALVEVFQARAIRGAVEQFVPHQAVLSGWIEQDILWPETLGLRQVDQGPGLEPDDAVEGVFRVRWVWPELRFVETCLLGVCREPPRKDASPEDVEFLFQTVVPANPPETPEAAFPLTVEAEWEGATVAVWAMVDAGWRCFHGVPLVLGRLERGRKRSGGLWKVFGAMRGRGGDEGKEAAQVVGADAENPDVEGGGGGGE